MATFDIIEYLSGMTAFVFDKPVLKRIALERGLDGATNYSELTQQQKDLCYADMLFVVYTSPNTTASYSASHGTFKKSVGSQTINDKQGIYNIMVSIYGKYSDEKLSVVQEMQSNLEWINSSEDDYVY